MDDMPPWSVPQSSPQSALRPAQIDSEPLIHALDDETLGQRRPAARGLLMKRLEDLYQVAGEEMDTGKDRVRWAELRLRTLDRLMKLWKLDGPEVPAGDDDDSAGIEQERLRQVVSLQLDELAQRADEDAG